jgi:hypothetical protein
MIGSNYYKNGLKVTVFLLLIIAILPNVSATGSDVFDPSSKDYKGRKGTIMYVSKSGNNSDGSSWNKAFHTIQSALSAIPDDRGGHIIVIRPDTYEEANLYPSFKGAVGSYNVLMGDYDGKAGSGAKGWVVIDSGDPVKGFKSYDFWGTIKATIKGWSDEHTDETFSSVIWDRWIFRDLYVSGGDAGLFFAVLDEPAPEFSVIVEDCVSIGRAFGGGVSGHVCRKDEPVIYRRTYLMSLDWWGDAGAALIRAHHKQFCENYDMVIDDCTLIAPDNAVQLGFGFDAYSNLKIKNSRLIVTNFSQPGGTPSSGIISVGKEGGLHIDIENCKLMGYKVFGSQLTNYIPQKSNLSFSINGKVYAYVQYQQVIPEGMERLCNWPVELFNSIGKFRIKEVK